MAASTACLLLVAIPYVWGVVTALLSRMHLLVGGVWLLGTGYLYYTATTATLDSWGVADAVAGARVSAMATVWTVLGLAAGILLRRQYRVVGWVGVRITLGYCLVCVCLSSIVFGLPLMKLQPTLERMFGNWCLPFRFADHRTGRAAS